MDLKAAFFQVLSIFWIGLLALICLAIYKYALFDVLRSWHYADWQLIDWILYVLGVLVYLTAFVLGAVFLTLKLAAKVKP